MALPVFGSKKRARPAPPAETGLAPGPSATEPFEFSEVAGAPAAASPPRTETVPAAIGAARALREVRARPPARKPVARGPRVSRPRASATARKPRKTPTKARQTKRPAPARKGRLTAKQLAQRKYAAGMRTVRKRARTAAGGKGRIAKRSPATRLRRQLGLKPGRAAARKSPARKKR